MQKAPAPIPPRAATVRAEASEKMPARFGKYTLIRKLAVGGMAELFLALQRSVAGFEKVIVLKRVLPNLAQDQSFIQMLLTEARIAATLSHPNIAHIYDVGEVDGQYYIAMEHVHGEDLRSLVRQMKKNGVNSFPLEHALAIVLGCCAGLAYAHHKRDLDGLPMGIVHRDVSPQNILVTFTGDVKLVDFGIAKAGHSSLEDTQSGQLKGKVPYMSPEQARGLPLDGRSDIFSLGILLFELSTGRRLFRGKNEVETLQRIVEEEYPRPRDLNPQLSLRLEEIVLRALQKDPARRYASARDMQADLEDYIRSEQLKVSSISLGAWMADLFKDKLDAQNQMLQEGRQLAEVLAAQAVDERDHSGIHSAVRQKPPPASKTPWVLLALVVAGALGGLGWVLLRGAPAGAPPGAIAIASAPSGAAIWLDGERRPERTPARIAGLPIGAAYHVKLTHEGFAPYTEHVRLSDRVREASIRAQLVRPSASDLAVLRVRTTPSGARVLLDGRDTGLVTPATIPELAPGVRHSLALALEGYVTRDEAVALEAGQVADRSFVLPRTPLGPGESLVRLVIDPPTARVRIAGQWYESGSPYELRLPARRYRVVVAKTGFRGAERELVLQGGRTSELQIELAREGSSRGEATAPRAAEGAPASSAPGRLTFDSTPWCNVRIDGRNAGQTPVVNVELAAGRHTVECENPQAGARRVTLEIAPGQHLRRAITLAP